MATAMDRSRFRNPDPPVGHVKKEPELRYKEGIVIDGYHYIYVPYLYDAHIDQREDYATLSDLILSDEEFLERHKLKGKTTDVLPASKIKKEKSDDDDEEEEEEGEVNDKISVRKKYSKYSKKSHSKSVTPVLDASLNIEFKKKKKKSKKHKRTVKIEPRSSSSSSSQRSPSPSPSHRSVLPTRKNLSPHRRSPSPRRRSPSPRRRSPSPHQKSLSPRRRSPAPNECREYLNVTIKQEHPDDAQHLFGSYYCGVCNITMNSLQTYNTHKVGKRHLKAAKLKSTPEVISTNIPILTFEDTSKYPKPPPGVIRKKVQTPAAIQRVVEDTLIVPCPGLNNVIEIQGLAGVQYYCSICDSVCSSNSILPHLNGYRHQLMSVKFLKPGTYECLQNKPKHKIENELKSVLRGIQKKEGIGRMSVEIEELIVSRDAAVNQPSTSRDYSSMPSTSTGITAELPELPFPERYDKATVPSYSASDYYCSYCHSHMNSIQMWEAHIRGKRHLTNLKKMPGDRPSKTKTIPVKKKAYLFDLIKRDCPPGEPIVGLNEIRETEFPETHLYSYQCFLCGSCHTSIDILEHLMSLKHRNKYLEHINFPEREIIAGMGDNAAYALVRDMCIQVENQEGPGNPAVHISKSVLQYR